MVLFGSEEWLKDVENVLEKNESFERAARGLTATFHFVIQITSSKERISFWLRIEDGKIACVEYGGIEDADYKIMGDISIWKDIFSGKIDPIEAIMQKKLILEGNIQAIMKHVRALSLLMEAFLSVPAEFSTSD